MNKKLLVLGNSGFLGKYVQRLGVERGWDVRGASLSKGFDLRNPKALEQLCQDWRPAVIVNCAAHVGGLRYSQNRQAEILADNSRMVLSLFDFLSQNQDIRLVNPIANCAFPGDLGIFSEGDFWSGAVHTSVLGYGGARRFSVLASEAYREQFGVDVADLALPNLFGPGDHLDAVRAHALGGLTYRIVSAVLDGIDEVSIWGTGRPIREWLYVEDAARAIVYAAEVEEPPLFLNIGTGEGISIGELAILVAEVAQFKGSLVFDPAKPDGAPEKRMSADQAQSRLGWRPHFSLEQGLKLAVEDVRNRLVEGRMNE